MSSGVSFFSGLIDLRVGRGTWCHLVSTSRTCTWRLTGYDQSFTQRWFNVGPPSAMMSQHRSNLGLMPRVCERAYWPLLTHLSMLSETLSHFCRSAILFVVPVSRFSADGLIICLQTWSAAQLLALILTQSPVHYLLKNPLLVLEKHHMPYIK